ncbi:hypothetical protein [Singulisphaera sp. GP187]|uniref:hypothetical protein n=1 Tax=Singulisphaera sp. GP187 TaxID=1882752 RepID=UPI000940A8DE|nr:hypothetical protein [Singulisphaera sp. GP187]
MNSEFPRFVPTWVIALGFTVALSTGAAQADPPKAGLPPADKPPATTAPAPATPPVAESEDDPWEERKTRAREDVEYLQAFHKAKLAECREAELRNTFALALKTEMDRQKQKGFASTYTMQQAAMSIAENQSQLEMRRVELKDVEIRLSRALRRLKAVERSASAYDTEVVQSDDRLRELEIKYERLRREFELAKRTVDLQKTRP